MSEQLATELAMLVRVLWMSGCVILSGALVAGYIWLLNWLFPPPKAPQPTPDLIDWSEVLPLLESVDAKLSQMLEPKPPLKRIVIDLPSDLEDGPKDTLCGECDDSGWGECLQLGHCDRPKVQEDMLKPTDGSHHCRWEWKPEQYQAGDWSDAEFRKAMLEKGFTLSAEAAVDPAALPPSQTLGECELTKYLSSLQAMRMGREAEIGDGGCCGGPKVAHPQPKVLPEDAV